MKFLFLLLLFFFLLGPVLRFAFRAFFFGKMNQFQKQQTKRQRPVRKEGEVRIDNVTPTHKQRTGSSEGQYIDFEEIKD